MMSELDAIILTIDMAAPRGVVWRCLTETDCIRAWWNPGVSLAPRVGGRFTEPWRDADGREFVTSGEVVQIAEPELLVLTWADADWVVETTVRWRLAGRSGGTHLELVHLGWEQFPDDQRAGLMDDHTAGWRQHLQALQAYAEAAAHS